MASNPKPFITPEEYLELESRAEHKSEYYQGEIFVMAGASPRHNLLTANIVGELRAKLKGKPCAVVSADLLVRTAKTGLHTYPDVVVVCGKPALDEKEKRLLLNPTVIVEVLSKSTKDYDRGGKFEAYREIESFSEYVLVAQDRFHVEHFARQADGSWLMRETDNLESKIKLSTLDCELELNEIYYNFDFFAGEE
ncbi:MAG: Uma2 family endonuclease [Acidobacteriota bacterium]